MTNVLYSPTISLCIYIYCIYSFYLLYYYSHYLLRTCFIFTGIFSLHLIVIYFILFYKEHCKYVLKDVRQKFYNSYYWYCQRLSLHVTLALKHHCFPESPAITHNSLSCHLCFSSAMHFFPNQKKKKDLSVWACVCRVGAAITCCCKGSAHTNTHTCWEHGTEN